MKKIQKFLTKLNMPLRSEDYKQKIKKAIGLLLRNNNQKFNALHIVTRSSDCRLVLGFFLFGL
jgi:hypothetical protein